MKSALKKQEFENQQVYHSWTHIDMLMKTV